LMRRIAPAIVATSLMFVILTGVPVRGAGVWDPNEPITRLDIRWVGAYEQVDGRIRLTITFYHPLRLRWFDPIQMGTLSTLVVTFSQVRDERVAFTFAVFGRHRDRVIAVMCEDQTGCRRGSLRRPNPRTLRVWFEPGALTPHAGWFFRARSWRDSGGVDLLDRTAWRRVT
jgi:hypothetical protein